jgi:DNA-binding XRE family transcriptional regulator
MQPETTTTKANCATKRHIFPWHLNDTDSWVSHATQNRKAVYVGKPQRHLVHRLKELRKIHHVTQEQFSERTGISYKYYQAIEAGIKKELRISTLERLATAYGIEVWQLLAPTIPQTRIQISRKV